MTDSPPSTTRRDPLTERDRSLFENISSGVEFSRMVYDDRGKPVDYIFLDVNRTFEKDTGRKRQDVLGKRATEVFPDIRHIQPNLIETYGEVVATGQPARLEVRFPPLDRWFAIYAFRTAEDEFCVTVSDISGKKRTESEMESSERRFRSIIEASPLGIHMYELNENNDLVFMGGNPSADRILGVANDQFVGKTIEQAFPPLEGTEVPARYRRAASHGEVWSTEQITYDHDRVQGAFHVTAFQTAPGRMVAMFSDITERKRAELDIKNATETQRALLREVNHRVKNNLSAIISMIHKEQDRAAITRELSPVSVLGGLETRIRGLLTVHTMLSESGWRPLPVHDLVKRIAAAACTGIPSDKTAEYTIDACDVTLSSNQAHHAAMVINELAANAIKHVLGVSSRITIGITVEALPDKRIRITVRDDGPGFPEAFLRGERARAGVGFDIISGIVRKNLKGTLETENREGAVITVEFDLESGDESKG